jgi:hypothetical protein
MRQEKVFTRNPGDKAHLFTTAGFRDDGWFNRTQWTIGAVAQAQLIVFDEQTAYGIQAYPNIKRTNFFRPGDKGYLLFAGQWKALPSRKPSASSTSSSGKRKELKQLWAIRVPVRVTAMALAGQTLFIAGPPDVVPGNDPYAAFEDRKGAKLWAVSAVDGAKLAEYELEHEPVFDAMAAVGGRLYIATTDGRVLCFCGGQS